jgi:hypothetical protein
MDQSLNHSNLMMGNAIMLVSKTINSPVQRKPIFKMKELMLDFICAIIGVRSTNDIPNYGSEWHQWKRRRGSKNWDVQLHILIRTLC